MFKYVRVVCYTKHSNGGLGGDGVFAAQSVDCGDTKYQREQEDPDAIIYRCRVSGSDVALIVTRQVYITLTVNVD